VQVVQRHRLVLALNVLFNDSEWVDRDQHTIHGGVHLKKNMERGVEWKQVNNEQCDERCD
jgi:hypothetical protein